jgi:hypothetical protein
LSGAKQLLNDCQCASLQDFEVDVSLKKITGQAVSNSDVKRHFKFTVVIIGNRLVLGKC